MDRLFSSYWLTSQVLPHGLGIVDKIGSPNPPRLHTPEVTKVPFTFLAALQDPKLFASTKGQGYAKVTVNITRGIAEVYTKSSNETDSDASPELEEMESLMKSPPTPPFFPLFRVFLNDRAVYQTRVTSLEPSRASGPETKLLSPESSPVESGSPSTEACSPMVTEEGDSLNLSAVYDLIWDEECVLNLHSPISIITLQFMDKDFCSSISLSEDLLTSVSVPLSQQRPGKPLDLVLQVYCNLPQSYSLESLTTAAERLAMQGESNIDMPLNNVLPSALKCKVHVSILVTPIENTSSIFLNELVALGLPRGPWTPESIVDSLTAEDQVTLIAGTELLTLSDRRSPVSVTSLVRAVGTLLSLLWSDKLEEGLEDLLQHEEVDQRKKLSYIKMTEDALAIIEHILVGPVQHMKSTIPKFSSSRSILTVLAGFAICLMILLQPRVGPMAISAILILFFHFLGHYHLPRPALDAKLRTDLSTALSNLQGADMITKPIESALLGPAAARKLHILELWISKLRQQVVDHPLTSKNSPQFKMTLLQAFRNPVNLLIIISMGTVNRFMRVFWPLVGAIAAIIILRKTRFVTSWVCATRGFLRMRELRKIRAGKISKFYGPH